MITDLKSISDQDMAKMLDIYSKKFNYSGGICVSTRKDGLVSVYSNHGKILFRENAEEVT